jgi:hypothetical protein
VTDEREVHTAHDRRDAGSLKPADFWFVRPTARCLRKRYIQRPAPHTCPIRPASVGSNVASTRYPVTPNPECAPYNLEMMTTRTTAGERNADQM